MRAAWWRTAAATLLVSAGLFGAGVGTGAGSASATMCAPPPRPVEVVTGGSDPDGTPYLAPGDYAVIGLVTAVELLPEPTATGPQQSWAPRYRVRMAARAYFAGPVLGERVDLGVVDLGMYGYPFQVGRSYFVPVKSGGELPPISLCEAVAQLTGGAVDDPYITELIAAATAKGVPAGRVHAEEADVPVQDGDGGGAGRLALAGLAGAALAVPLTLLAVRLRSRRAAGRAAAAPAEADREGPAGP